MNANPSLPPRTIRIYKDCMGFYRVTVRGICSRCGRRKACGDILVGSVRRAIKKWIDSKDRLHVTVHGIRERCDVIIPEPPENES